MAQTCLTAEQTRDSYANNMVDSRRLSHSVRAFLLPGLCVAVIAFFGWHMLAGEGGLLALGGHRTELAQLESQAAETAARRADLERKVALLGDRAEPDYTEELVRERLGLVRDDEIIVRLDD